MAEEKTIRIMVLIGTMLQIIILIYCIYLIAIYLPNILPLVTVPELIPILLTMYQFIFGIFIIIQIICIIGWLFWQSNPSSHRGGFIATGILGMIFGMFIAGLIILIAGILSPKTK